MFPFGPLSNSLVRHKQNCLLNKHSTHILDASSRQNRNELVARPETLAGEPEVVSEPGHRLLDLPLRVDHPFDVGHQQPVLAHENVIDVHLNVPEKKRTSSKYDHPHTSTG